MNILFILGNGFDKAQGLNTSYQDFYDYYKKIKPASELEARVQREIQSDYKTWADMEEGLGKYSAQFESVDEFMQVLRMLNSRLKTYLLAESERIGSMGLSATSLNYDIRHPERWLEPKQRTEYQKLMPSNPGEIITVNCVTLNYTNTLELLMDKQNTRVGFLGDPNINPVFWEETVHLHGTLDDMILLGVNDPSQIANESFRDNELLIEEFVKPEINNGCENMRNETVLQFIGNADVIVLFGVSVGMTDSIWWHTIGSIVDNPYRTLHLVYYPFNPDLDTEGHPNSKLRWSKDYIAFLKERMGINLTVEELRQYFYIGINKSFLNLRGEGNY